MFCSALLNLISRFMILVTVRQKAARCIRAAAVFLSRKTLTLARGRERELRPDVIVFTSIRASSRPGVNNFLANPARFCKGEGMDSQTKRNLGSALTAGAYALGGSGGLTLLSSGPKWLTITLTAVAVALGVFGAIFSHLWSNDASAAIQAGAIVDAGGTPTPPLMASVRAMLPAPAIIPTPAAPVTPNPKP